MRNIRYLVQRNIDLFLNNKLNILLSFASIPIVIALYAFFLRDFLIDIIGQTMVPREYVREFTDRFMFAGLLVVINTTTCFGIIQIFVNDAASGIRKDFLAAPITIFSVLTGYWISAGIVSAAFTCATVLGGEIFFQIFYGSTLSFELILQILLITFCSSCVNAGILLCLAKNLKSTTTFSTFANLYGTVIGFLSGCYLPYYFYPEWLTPILFWYAPTQITSILRQTYVDTLLPLLEKGANEQYLNELLKDFGIYITRNETVLTISQQYSIIIMALAILLLFLWVSSSEDRKHPDKRL